MINTKTRQPYSIDKLVESEQEGIFDFNFLPTEPGTYRCSLQFNNKHIKGILFGLLIFFMLSNDCMVNYSLIN